MFNGLIRGFELIRDFIVLVFVGVTTGNDAMLLGLSHVAQTWYAELFGIKQDVLVMETEIKHPRTVTLALVIGLVSQDRFQGSRQMLADVKAHFPIH